MLISIITPTFNRKNYISRSINSSLELIKSGVAFELIVVDDASTDNTTNFLKSQYKREIKNGHLKTLVLENNVGATGAKNRGAELASGDWLIFMDSDDFFLPNIGKKIATEIINHKDFDIIFFRCLDETTNSIIGPAPKKTTIDFKTLLNNGTPGECLPAIKRNKFLSTRYRDNLRGCESLTYIEMAAQGSSILISDIVARGYRSIGDDRLSNRKNIYLRADKMYEYNKLLFKYNMHMSTKSNLKIITKIAVYYFMSKILELKPATKSSK